MASSICDILPSAAAVLGVADADDRLGLAGQVGDARRVAVVLVDGLGYHLLGRLAEHAPLLASVAAGDTGRLHQLSCTFPSTTPTSLVSLGTGAAPGAHGVLGFTVRVPDTERVLVHIAWGDDPPPSAWQPVETWFARAQRAQVPARAVLPAAFVGSGLTAAAYGGAELRAVADGDDYARVLGAEVAAAPGLVYGYTSVLDTAAHLFGIGSPQWHDAAANVDALVARLLETLPDDAALLVTADHGGLNVPADARVDCGADPQLAAGVATVAGEARVRYLHTEPGAARDVAASWAGILGERAEVKLRDDAVAAGWFGPVEPRNLARIGDVVVCCTGETAVLASGHEPPAVAALTGFHGAASPAEMAIPLMVFGG